MSDWKPGDVAIWGSEHERVFFVDTGKHQKWIDCEGDSRAVRVGLLRPVVVIDPEDRKRVERLRDLFDAEVILQGDDPDPRDVTPTARGNALQAALREFANPTPPKPDEPTGLGAVVRADHGGTYTRVSDGCWVPEGRGLIGLSWGEFNAVEVLSEGVQP